VPRQRALSHFIEPDGSSAKARLLPSASPLPPAQWSNQRLGL